MMSGRVQEQLPALFALAHDRSEPARVRLASQLAELFLSEDVNLSEREEYLLNELIDQLLVSKSTSVRNEFVRKFENVARMPRKLAMSFACDAIDIARDVLLNNEALNDSDLIIVIENQSKDHALLVAQRKSINEAVADALVTTGDLRVMQTVAENMGAKLSPMALTVLAEAARLTAVLHEPIMYRPELTEEVAVGLYWWVSQGLRRYALERFDIGAGRLDDQLAKAIDVKLAVSPLDKVDDEAMKNLAEWLDERQIVNATILPKILRMGHFRLFNILLSRMTKLELHLIDSIVAETGGRMLAAVCRAVGVDKANFVSIFLLSRGARPGEQIVHPREMSFALIAFDRLSVAVANEMVKSWLANPNYVLSHTGELALES